MDSREDILLRASYDLLTRIERNGGFVVDGCETRYDNANCGCDCLREDIADELGIDTETDPIGLEMDVTE
jgi:hypothetical protein